jgi:hypothetical protein
MWGWSRRAAPCASRSKRATTVEQAVRGAVDYRVGAFAELLADEVAVV